MVIHARSSRYSQFIKFYLAGLLLLGPAFAISSTNPDSISFDFHAVTLNEAFQTLIQDHELNLVFPNELGSNVIKASCENCSPDEALQSLLSYSNYLWQKSENQYIIYKPIEPFRFGISGQAVDSTSQEPIPFANVFIKDLNIGDISQSNGFFSISNISANACTLSVSYIGYETEKVFLSFPRDEDKFLKIPLSKRIISSDEVFITGESREFMEQSNSPGTISFSPRHISTLPNLGEVDIFRSLQLLPGIQLGSGGTSDLFIRGGTPSQNLVLLDGIPLYNSSHMFGFIGGVNANAIKDIQVFKGGAPAKYGGRVSSYIELTSKNGNSLSPHGAFYGNLMSQGITFGLPLFSRGSWIINYRSSTATDYQSQLYKSIQGFVTGDDNFNLLGETAKEGQTSIYAPQFSYQDLMQRISFILTPKHRLTVTQSVAKDSIKEDRAFYGFSNFLFYDSTYSNGVTEWKTQGNSYNISSQWSPESNTQLTFSALNFESNYFSENSAMTPFGLTELSSSHETNSINDKSYKLNYEHKGIQHHKLNTGIEETFYKINYIDVKTEGTNSNKNSFIQEGFLHSFYVQDHWSFRTRFQIHTGLRLNYFKNNESFKSSPRVSVVFQPSSNITLESSIGRYHQFIHKISGSESTRGTQGMWLLSSNSIPILSATNFHFGLNVTRGKFNFSLEGYRKKLTDLVQFTGALSPTDYVNNRKSNNDVSFYKGAGNVYGIELLFRKKKGSITGWISYHFNRSTESFPDLNLGKEFLSNHDKTHEIKSVFMTRIGSFDFTANWVFSSGHVYTHSDQISVNDSYQLIYNTNLNEERLPPVHRLDLSISKDWDFNLATIHAGFSIYNLYNRDNVSHRRYNPYTPSISLTDVSMFGITPTLFIKTSF